MYHPPLRLLQDGFLRSAAETPDLSAVIAEGVPCPYHRLADTAARLAAALRRRGLRPGDRVAIFMDNTIPCAASIFGTLLAGGVFLVINPQTKADKLGFILADSGARVLLTDAHLLPVVTAARPGVPQPFAIVAAGRLPDPAPDGIEAFDPVTTAESPLVRPSGAIPLDLAALIYTSGSTGQPKGVMMTHQAMVFACGSLIEYLRLSPTHRLLNVLPLAFDYGLYQLLMAVTLGATLVLERSFTYPALILQRMREHAVTVFPGVPTIFATLLSMHRKSPLQFPDVQRVTNTAAALPDNFVPGLREVFPNALIYKMYGLTECKRVCYLEPELVDQRPGSVGRPMPGTEVLLLSPDGQPVPAGETGILHVRGPHVMQGYWKRPDLSAEMLRPGLLPGERMLCAQDWFRMDEEGLLYFVGRSDDIIKTRGEKVSPVEVENVLHAMPGIRQAAVVGHPDDLLGQAIHAHIVPEPGADLTPQSVKGFCQARLENFMVPKEVFFRDELPQTLTGKVRRRDLGAAAPVPPAPFRELLARLEAGLQALPDKPEDTPEATLRALWHTAAGHPCSAAAAMEIGLPDLGPDGEPRLRQLIDRRLAGDPLAHLTGRQRFMGLELLSGPQALIPRRETELLARSAREQVRAAARRQGAARVADACCGAGNVALAMAHAEPRAMVWGADLSEEAVGLAQRNAERLGLAERVECRRGDLLEPFQEWAGTVDVLTCNPPYISSKGVTAMPDEIARHEPRMAFDGGPFGVNVLVRLLREAPALLKPGGWLCVEVGRGQGPAMMERARREAVWAEVRGVVDEAGEIRVLMARKTGGAP